MSARRAPYWIVASALFAAWAADARAAAIDIRFSLDRAVEGPAAPFLLALEKGYYKVAGLNVTIEPAANSLEPIKRVASGNFDLGFADINVLIKFRDADPKAPVKAIFIVYNRPPYAVIARKSRGIAVPKDLEGKRLGAPADGAAFAAWPIFAKANGVDLAKVTVENVGVPVRDPMLAAGQVDAITGLTYSSFANLKDRGVPVSDLTVMLMANYGVDLYGSAIIVNTTFAAAHPEAVKGFLGAFLKGLKETVRSPAAAIGAVLKQSDSLKKELESERLSMVIRDNIVTSEVAAQGYGGVDVTRFARALDQLALVYKFRHDKPKYDEVFDGSFLPPPEDRKIR